MCRRTITYALASALMLLAAGAAFSNLYRSHAERELNLMAERNNLALSRVFANTIWAEIEPNFAVGSRGSQQSAELTRSAETLVERVSRLLHGSSVAELVVYDTAGRIAYSTDGEDIGEIKHHDAGFAAALGGRIASAIAWKDHIDSLEGRIS